MNPKTRILITTAAGLALAVALSQCGGPPTPATGTPGMMDTPSSPTAEPGTSTTTESTDPTLMPTRHSFSDAEVTIVVTSSAIELRVEDIATFTVTAVNTGQLRVDKPYCILEVYSDDGTSQRIVSHPVLDPPYSGDYLSTGEYIFLPGDIGTATFSLRATNPGTVKVIGAISGLVKLSPSSPESWVGWESTPLTIYVR